MTINW